MILKQFSEQLVCPEHRRPLNFYSGVSTGGAVPFPDGKIKCPEGCHFDVKGGIPRICPIENYSSSFGVQWVRYQKTQLDSHCGISLSKNRLERCLGFPLKNLKGKMVLEVGSGAGRFTEHLIEESDGLVSMDLSIATEANLANMVGKRPYLLVQGDINRSPLPFGSFDIVVCLGVIQHTTSPEKTITDLAQHVKPGGMLIIDHYLRYKGIRAISRHLAFGKYLRLILRRIDPRTALKVTSSLTRFFDPLRRFTSRWPFFDNLVHRVVPTVSYYGGRIPGLDLAIIPEWNELDTHDSLTDYYKHQRTPEEIEYCLKGLGFNRILVWKGGNGVEARAFFPEDQ